MLKTWKVDYFPAYNKYMLDLILNEKIYPIEISKEFAKELGYSALIDSFIEQTYINENKRLKSENAALRERLDKAVGLPCEVGSTVYSISETDEEDNFNPWIDVGKVVSFSIDVDLWIYVRYNSGLTMWYTKEYFEKGVCLTI